MPEMIRIEALRVGHFRGIGVIVDPVELRALGPALNLVWGPNGRGKTCTGEAIGALLWGQRGNDPEIDISAEIVAGRVRSNPVLSAGQAEPVPGLPDRSFAPLYRLSLHELIRGTEGTGDNADDLLAERIRGELYGRISLTGAAEKLGFDDRLPTRGLAEYRAHVEACKSHRDTESQQDGVRGDMQALEHKLNRREALQRQTAVESLVNSLIALRDAGTKRNGAQAELEAFDQRLAQVGKDDNEQLGRLKQELEEQQAVVTTAGDDLQRAEEALKQAGFGNDPIPDAPALDEADTRATRLRDIDTSAEGLRRDLASEQKTLEQAETKRNKAQTQLDGAQGKFLHVPKRAELDELQRELDAVRAHTQEMAKAEAECAAQQTELDQCRESASIVVDANALSQWLDTGATVPNVQGLISAEVENATAQSNLGRWQDEAHSLKKDIGKETEMDGARADAIASMRHWVQAETQQETRPSELRLAPAITACVLFLVAIIALAVVAGPYWLIGILGPAAIAVWCWRIRSAAGAKAATPIIPPNLDAQVAPPAWRVPAVLDTIGRHLEARAKHAALSEQQLRAATLTEQAEQEAKDRSTTAAELRTRLQGVCGLTPTAWDAITLQDLVRVLGDARQHFKDLLGARKRVETWQQHRDEAAERLCTSLKNMLGRRPADVSAAAVELEQARQARADLIECQQKQQAATEKRDEIQDRIAKLQHEREQRESEGAGCLERLRGTLEDYDLDPESLTDGIAATAQIRRLHTRAEQHRNAIAARESAQKLADETQSKIDDLTERCRAFCIGRDLPMAPEDWDDAQRELTALMDTRDLYRDAETRLQKAEGAVLQTKAPLENRDVPPELGAMDVDSLKARLQTIKLAKEELYELEKQINSIEKDIELARSGHSIEAAKATRNAAIENLKGVRDRTCAAAIGDLLCDFLRSHIQAVTSSSLNRAQELFSAFTGNTYELQLQDATPPVLTAFHRLKEKDQRLSELSSGTRMQLLMAARIGFLETHEPDKRPPLILDEALAISDPERRRAIMQAVVEITRDGRQVFYFTAQPEEISQWQGFLSQLPQPIESKLHELGNYNTARAAQVLVDWQPTPTPEPTPTDTIETYGESLRVPLLNPRDKIAEAHLWYVVDSPEILYRYLRLVSDRCGGFQRVAEQQSGTELADALEFTEAGGIGTVLRRIEILERCNELWRIGRGEPVTAGAIRDSGAISKTYWEETIKLNQTVSGDARALLAGLLHIPAKRTLRADLKQKLEDYLVMEGYLSTDKPLTLDEALRRLRIEFGDRPEIENAVRRAGLDWE